MPSYSEEYFGDPLDALRSLFYHEFGHHVHQMKGLKKRDVYGYNSKTDTLFVGKYEKRLLAMWDGTALRKKMRSEGVSHYGRTQAVEWFAENFALWAMRRDDVLGSEFKQFITEILGDKG